MEKKVPDLKVFSIWDSKVQSYRSPQMAINNEDMIRQLMNMMRDPSQARNGLLVNAEDYQLFAIGIYDYKSGTLQGFQPEHVANLHELKAIVLREQAPAPQVGH